MLITGLDETGIGWEHRAVIGRGQRPPGDNTPA